MTIIPIKDTPRNRRLKYAWLKYAGYNRTQARTTSRSELMPAQFYDDLERWFFYKHGQLIPDQSDGEVNKLVEAIEHRGKILGNKVLTKGGYSML